MLVVPKTRLHITPLNSQLFPAILPTPLLEKASNISFHELQTFPEKNYGFLDLPEADADKLRKKLNGCILKGSKMRVEVARAAKKKEKEENEPSTGERTKTKRKRDNETDVIPGHELQDRKVKRGWTEPASSEGKSSRRRKEKEGKREKTKVQSHTGESECLFKTSIPPNAVPTADPTKGKAKKRKRGDTKQDVVIHEFTNNTKHATFLRDESASQKHKGTREYVEGKGWLDEEGNVVEPEVKRRRSKSKPTTESIEKDDGAKPRSRRSSRLEVPSLQVSPPRTRSSQAIVEAEEETSSSGTSSSSDSDSGSLKSEVEPSSPQDSLIARHTKIDKRAKSTADNGNEVDVDRVERLSITRSSASPPLQNLGPTSAPISKEVHPLEALFKRPNTAASLTSKKPNLEVSTSFNLADPDQDESSSQGLLIPQTPFTKQDIRQRRQRSAAPTPDTAAPGKTFGKLWDETSDISDGDDEMETEVTAGSEEQSATPRTEEEKPESDFRKFFYENRGANRRGMKKRKKEAAKNAKRSGRT